MLTYYIALYSCVKPVKFVSAHRTSDMIKRASIFMSIIALIKDVKYTDACSNNIFCYTYNYHTLLYMVIGKALMRLPVIHLI